MAHPKLDYFLDKCIPEPNSGCWLWEGAYSKVTGYGNYKVSPIRADSPAPAHRASWIIHNGEIPDGILVCHRCDNRTCVNPEHLFLGTHKDNSLDASKKGRLKYRAGREPNAKHGERHPMVKISEEEVLAIRASGQSGYSLAKQYGVSKTQIYRIRDGRAWRSL